VRADGKIQGIFGANFTEFMADMNVFLYRMHPHVTHRSRERETGVVSRDPKGKCPSNPRLARQNVFPTVPSRWIQLKKKL
jgi:hypothetical protein